MTTYQFQLLLLTLGWCGLILLYARLWERREEMKRRERIRDLFHGVL